MNFKYILIALIVLLGSSNALAGKAGKAGKLAIANLLNLGFEMKGLSSSVNKRYSLITLQKGNDAYICTVDNDSGKTDRCAKIQ